MTRIPALPPSAPRTDNRFGRWIGRSLLRLGGWTIAGDWPDVPRMVVIAAPHSSGWDAVWGLAAKLALGRGHHLHRQGRAVLGAAGLAAAPFWRAPGGPWRAGRHRRPDRERNPRGRAHVVRAGPGGHPQAGRTLEDRVLEDRPPRRRAGVLRLVPLPGQDHRPGPAGRAHRRPGRRHGPHPRSTAPTRARTAAPSSVPTAPCRNSRGVRTAPA